MDLALESKSKEDVFPFNQLNHLLISTCRNGNTLLAYCQIFSHRNPGDAGNTNFTDISRLSKLFSCYFVILPTSPPCKYKCGMLRSRAVRYGLLISETSD